MLSRGRKELVHITEGEGRREVDLGKPLLSVDTSMSYTSLGRKTMGGWRQALAMEHCEAWRTSTLAAGTVQVDDEPEEEEEEEDSWEGGTAGTCRLLRLVLRLESGCGAGPGLCLLITVGP